MKLLKSLGVGPRTDEQRRSGFNVREIKSLRDCSPDGVELALRNGLSGRLL